MLFEIAAMDSAKLPVTAYVPLRVDMTPTRGLNAASFVTSAPTIEAVILIPLHAQGSRSGGCLTRHASSKNSECRRLEPAATDRHLQRLRRPCSDHIAADT